MDYAHGIQLLVCLEPTSSLFHKPVLTTGAGMEGSRALIFKSLGPDVLSASGRIEEEVLDPVPE